MPNQKNLRLILITATLLSLMFVAAVNSNFTYAQNEKFKAKLKGENEVPPVNSSATGKAKFKVKDDVITTNINVTGLTDITAAQIYAGTNGQNGEPVVDLLKTGNQSNAGERIIVKGEITASDLQGPMSGKTLQDLQTAMGNEETYVNIQTSDNPDGEIRGQIKVSGSNATTVGSMDESATDTDEEE
ncbi:MAG TPA: CHRD domain-containing protein [Nitrososphaeraceae archaeon]|nr:CHRD domain-containing protein [Nitrososphaeraceae archaeon]